MRLYLMQHGKAMTKEEHPERPLTAEGKADIRNVAAWLAPAGLERCLLWHSGKQRALETAQALARSWNIPEEQVCEVAGLKPTDDVKSFAERVQQQTGSIIIVGHLPFLDRLSSYLVTGDPERTVVRFQMGGIVCLEPVDERWVITWMVVPELVTAHESAADLMAD